MTAQAKPTVEGVDNVPLEENQYEEEETTESVLGIIIIIIMNFIKVSCLIAQAQCLRGALLLTDWHAYHNKVNLRQLKIQ